MLKNISFLALFVFLTSCFASTPTKIHSAFSHLVRPFAIYAQCGLNLFFFRQNNDVCWRKEKINDYPQSYHQRDRNAVFALVTEGTSVASTPG